MEDGRWLVKILALAVLSIAFGFGQSNEGVPNPKIELLQRVCGTLESCQEALQANRQSSLLHFRIGESGVIIYTLPTNSALR
jgi:hypothetical protein